MNELLIDLLFFVLGLIYNLGLGIAYRKGIYRHSDTSRLFMAYLGVIVISIFFWWSFQ